MECRATDKPMIEITVNFRSQLQECTARQEVHLGDVIFKKEKRIEWKVTTDILLFFLYSDRFTKTATCTWSHSIATLCKSDVSKHFCSGTILTSGPGSVVGIATAYGLDRPRIESRWGEIFRTSPDRP